MKIDRDYVLGAVIGVGVAAAWLMAGWVGFVVLLVGFVVLLIVQKLARPRPTSVAIAGAWRLIEACRYRNPDDGCCAHPLNPTPECHGDICPLVRDV